MRVRLLGPMEVDSGSVRLSPRDRIVLASLAVRPGELRSAEALADALWGDSPPGSWTKVVQGCISRLRVVLGEAAISTEGRGYRLAPDAVDLDTGEFTQLAELGRAHLDSGAPERAVALLRRALDLWRGRPFEELEDWLPGRLEAERLGELRLTVEEDLLQALLDAGEHRQVATEGTVLVGEEPWRERRWELLTLARYRSGRQADALATIRSARRALGRELGLDPGSGLIELERAILAQDPSLTADHEARVASDECPWRGLASYDADHSEVFFGRAEDIEQCLRRLESAPLLALVGPSGCGKSSLMKAGLAAALRARGRQVVILSPGADPFSALAEARMSVEGPVVLCVDQFEEAFTGTLDATGRREWLAQVAKEAAGGSAVVLTVRSDYLADLALDPGFAELVEQGLHLVSPLAGESLREVIEEPARLAGLRLEHGLVDLLLREAQDQPGALPLLSHALAETWLVREGPLLTVDGYLATGGLGGAVAASAERLATTLTDAGRFQLKWLMLRMGSLADHGEPVRTPVPRQVVTDDPERSRVVDLLVRSRLVTSVGGAYELAHESLVRAWPQLRAWLEEDRDGQRLWRHLASAAIEWDRLGRPDSELYQGIRLETATEWASRHGSQPTRLEAEFLDASVAHADAERLALASQARNERRQNRRLRGLLVGVATLLVISLVTALLAVDQQRTAAGERDRARGAELLALHESLVGRSLTLRSTNRAAAALLAVESWRARKDALAESALLGTFTEAPGFMGYRSTPYDIVQGAPIPGTDTAILASGSRIHVVDLVTGELGPPFDHAVRENTNQQVLRVSGDGRRVVQLLFDPVRIGFCGHYDGLVEDDGRGCTLLTVFDIERGEPVFGPVSTPFSGGDVAIDHRGTTIAVTGGFDGDVATYDVDSGLRLGRLAGLPRPDEVFNWRDTGAVAFDRDGRLFLGSMNGPVRRLDPRTLEVVRTYGSPPMSTHNYLVVTPRGHVVAAGDRSIVSFDAASGRRDWIVDLSDNPDEFPCWSFAVAPAMGRLYCGSSYGEIEERSLRDGQLTGLRLDPQLGEVGDLAVTDDNELVAFAKGYYRWRLDGSGPISHLLAPGDMTTTGYDQSGRFLAVSPRLSWEGHRVLDLRTGEVVSTVPGEGDLRWLTGRTLLLTGEEGSVLVDASTGRSRKFRDERLRGLVNAFPAEEERAWGVLEGADGGSELVEFDVGSGAGTGQGLQVPGFAYDVQPAGAATVWVNYFAGGSHLDWSDQEGSRAALVDLASGRFGTTTAIANGAVSKDGRRRIVGSGYDGEIFEYDPDTLERVAALPGSRGGVADLFFSGDSRRLLTRGNNGLVQVYDTEGWVRLGALPAEISEYVPEGWLRPDGRAAVVNNRRGVVEWDLEPERMAAAACTVAGRNLSRVEWATYMGDVPYRRTCPAYPAGDRDEAR